MGFFLPPWFGQGSPVTRNPTSPCFFIACGRVEKLASNTEKSLLTVGLLKAICSALMEAAFLVSKLLMVKSSANKFTVSQVPQYVSMGSGSRDMSGKTSLHLSGTFTNTFFTSEIIELILGISSLICKQPD